MPLTVQRKSEIVSQYQRGPVDTGSPDVQVALLSAEIDQLSDHFKAHAQDHHSRQGLLRKVSRRRQLLDYLRRADVVRYRDLIARLGLRR
jgi:small subunit ribosomal protein S15